MTKRKTIETYSQGQDEQIAYTLDTTPWGNNPSNTVVKIYSIDEDDGSLTDVSSTCLEGTPSENGNIITLPTVKSLTPKTVYRLEIKFTLGGNIFEAYTTLYGEL